MTHVSLPAAEDTAWPIRRGLPGMETLLLLTRESQLPAGLDLRSVLSTSLMREIQNPRSLVWFDDWSLVQGTTGRERDPSFFEEKLDDPILNTIARLKQRLEAEFSMIRTVSFANQGR